MKKISKDDIKDKEVSYVEFQLPLIGEYWNASRFVELFKLNAYLMLAERDEMTGEQVYLVRMQTAAFKKSKMSYGEIKEVIANTFNICCDEHNKEKREKEEADNKKLNNFITNGFNHENLLDIDFQELKKPYQMQEMQESVQELLNEANSTKDKESKLSMYIDVQNLLDILYYLRRWELEEVYNVVRQLDTFIREYVPDSVLELVRDYY